MPVFNIKGDKFPIKAYLKADSFSQHFEICNEKGEVKELVTPDMFWGKTYNAGLYLDYSLIKNRIIRVTEGISCNNGIQILRDDECDNWLQENIFNLNESKVFVFQGYAGCGKTTFMNNFLCKQKRGLNSFYIDVGKDWAYPQEPYMFFNEALNSFDIYVEKIIRKKSTRDKIWNEFIKLGSDLDIKTLDLQLPNIIPEFIKIKNNSDWKTLRINLHGYLNITFSNKIDITDYPVSGRDNYIWHNYGQTQTIVSLLILIICAQILVENRENLFNDVNVLIFDNLDVITDPALSAENVVTLWGVIHRYISYKNIYKQKTKHDLPEFGIFIAVRKVLYSYITSYLPDLEMYTSYNPYFIRVCDISDLYLSQDILMHRISYWIKNIDDSDIAYKLAQLKEIKTIHTKTPLLEYEVNEVFEDSYEIQSTINLDAFFNHNYRALSNVLSVFLENKRYTNSFLLDFNTASHSKEWQKVATLVFEISLLYKNSKVWNTMGFGCEDFSLVDYPTTLNRLILNYLYISKCGQALASYANNRKSIPIDDHVSLRDIIQIFENVKFISIDKKLNDEQINRKYESEDLSITKKLIIERLADMCARNTRVYHSSAYGYDCDDDELWRRPLYFVDGVKLDHTAASSRELKLYFEEAVNENRDDKILFSITDEGFVLIHDIVASFEFYSARYGKSLETKPLHQVVLKEELDALIRPVYDAVSLCCKRHNLFMKQYMKQYDIDINEYLNRWFHPRTKPRFDNQISVGKKLSEYSFRPQLHIVRVLYAHIDYFDKVKDFFSKSDIEERDIMCRCLTDWIERYLILYRNYFYNTLKFTVCNSDNNVYRTLNELLKEQKIHYMDNGDQKNINISNR